MQARVSFTICSLLQVQRPRVRLPAAKIPQIMHVHTGNLFHRLITTDMAINGNAFADTRKKSSKAKSQEQPFVNHEFLGVQI